MATSYSRVLLEAGLFFRPFVTAGGQRGRVADASSLQFLVEELIAHSAVEVGIPAISVLGEAVDVLPATIRKRVRILDADRRILARCDALFSDIAEELHLSLGGRGVALLHPRASQVHADAAGLYLDMYPYLLALEYEMEVAVDVPGWAETADEIRHQLKNPTARAVLASISGIARAYQPITVESPVVRPNAHPQLTEQFEQLLEDQAYKELSEENRLFGVPAKMEGAKLKVSRALRSLLTKPKAKQLLDSGTRVLSTAASLPIPESDVISGLLERNYLPPLVSFDALVKRAEAAWKLARPEFVPLPGYEYNVLPEWD